MNQQKGHPISNKKASRDPGKVKSKLHPRSKHRDRYDFKELIKSSPELEAYVRKNIHGDESIDFADPKAVKSLNKALLNHHYGIEHWDIPDGYLCPPIPGRADYIHHMADLITSSNYGKMPAGDKITCLDIGVGANCIYPLIGNKEYGWSFIGSDIDPHALKSARKIIASNPEMKGKIELKLQDNPKDYFYGVIRREDQIDFSICNPPFHASAEEAQSVSQRKLKNLNIKTSSSPQKNFGGQPMELWSEGGEKRFVSKMIRQSRKFAASCYWFTSLVSKESNLKRVYEALKVMEAEDVKTIPIGQGNKKSRIVAWTFLTSREQKQWKESRWQ